MDISKLSKGTQFYKIRITNDGEVSMHRCVISGFPGPKTMSGKFQFKYLEWYPNGTYERAWGREDLFDKVVCDRYGRMALCLAEDISEAKEKFVKDSDERLARKERDLETERRWQGILKDLADISAV